MAGKDSQEKKPEEPKKEEFDSEGFKEFLGIIKATGRKIPDKLNDELESELKAEFGKWDEDGRPRPEIPKSKKKASAIEKVYRRMVLGKEKISWITSDGKHEGLRVEPIYGKNEDEDGNEYTDESIVIGETKHFEKDWSDKIGAEIMEKAIKTCPQPKFYFVSGPHKIAIKNPQKNFLGNFEEIIQDVIGKKTVY